MQYDKILRDPPSIEKYSNLALNAFIQAITQIVEAMAGLEKPLGLNFKELFGHKNGNKEREYWKFCVRYTHFVGARVNIRSVGDPDYSDRHRFHLGGTYADRVTYSTLTQSGPIHRLMSTERISCELQEDLKIFSSAALSAMQSQLKR